MPGKNTIELNAATVEEAFQHYLSKLFTVPVKVTNVATAGASGKLTRVSFEPVHVDADSSGE